MAIHSYRGVEPKLGSEVFIAPSADVIGDVTIGPGSSVWYGCVLRGDTNFIRVGSKTNIQDLTVVHVAAQVVPTIIGDEVTIGHRAIVHACTIGNRCLIGMGAIVMDRAIIGDDCIIAAGSLVPEGMIIPAGTLVMGTPAKPKRSVHAAEKEWLLTSSRNYYELAKTYVGL